MSYRQNEDGTISMHSGNVDVETDIRVGLGDFEDEYDVQGIISRFAREGIIAYSSDLLDWYWTNKCTTVEEIESIEAEYDVSNF